MLAIGNSLGFDPIQFGVPMVIVMQLGAITPPVGTFLFISCGVAKLPVEKAAKPLLPYIATVVIVVALAFVFPPLVTWLPGSHLRLIKKRGYPYAEKKRWSNVCTQGQVKAGMRPG